MTELLSTAKLVKSILEEDSQARNSDSILYLRVLERIAKEKGAVAAVVGLPRNMDGSEGARADRCRDFARRLSAAAEIPVAMTDERLTTVAASRYLNETDTRGGKRKNIIDSLSAEIILQNTLDRLKNMP